MLLPRDILYHEILPYQTLDELSRNRKNNRQSMQLYLDLLDRASDGEVSKVTIDNDDPIALQEYLRRSGDYEEWLEAAFEETLPNLAVWLLTNGNLTTHDILHPIEMSYSADREGFYDLLRPLIIPIFEETIIDDELIEDLKSILEQASRSYVKWSSDPEDYFPFIRDILRIVIQKDPSLIDILALDEIPGEVFDEISTI